MDRLEDMDKKQFIFGALLVVANRIDTLMERELKEYGITTKQWFLSVVIDNLFSCPPTIKEAARESGSSHQNIKQVALKLEKKDLIKLIKDEKDARVTRLVLTEKSRQFWQSTEPSGKLFMEKLFDGICEEDLKATKRTLQKLVFNLDKMDKLKG